MAKNFSLAVVISAIDRISPTLRGVSSRIAESGARASNLGRSWSLGVTAPVVALFSMVAVKSLQAEKALDQFRAASQADAAGIARAMAAARAAGGPFDVPQSLNAMAAISQAGLDLENTLLLFPRALDLAIASGEDLEATAGSVAGVLRAFKKDAGDATRVVDILAGGRGRSGVGALADGLRDVAPLALAAGHTLESTAAALVALERSGAAPAATYRATVLALNRLSVEGERALARLRIGRADLVDSQGRLTDLVSLLTLLEARGASAGDVLSIFGRKAGPTMVALLQQGSASLEKQVAAMGRVGEATRQASERLDQGQGSIWEFTNATDALVASLASSGVIELMTKFVDLATRAANAFANLPQPVKTFLVDLAALVAALGPVVWLIGKLITIGVWLAKTWAWIGRVVAWVALRTTPLGRVLWVVYTVIGLLIANWDKWTDSISRWLRQFEPVRKALEWLDKRFGDGIGPVSVMQMASAETSAARQVSDGLSRAGAGAPAVAPGRGGGELALARMRDSRASTSFSQQGEIRVRFENAPPGMSARVTRQSGLDIGLDVGVSMAPG